MRKGARKGIAYGLGKRCMIIRTNVIPVFNLYLISLSDLSPVFEVEDIFTRKDTISGLKSTLWAGLG